MLITLLVLSLNKTPINKHQKIRILRKPFLASICYYNFSSKHYLLISLLILILMSHLYVAVYFYVSVIFFDLSIKFKAAWNLQIFHLQRVKLIKHKVSPGAVHCTVWAWRWSGIFAAKPSSRSHCGSQAADPAWRCTLYCVCSPGIQTQAQKKKVIHAKHGL